MTLSTRQTARRRNTRSTRLGIQNLESRQMMAGDLPGALDMAQDVRSDVGDTVYESASIDAGWTRIGTLSRADKVDVYAVDLKAGRSVDVNFQSSHSEVTLFDSVGNEVANGRRGIEDFFVSETGTYFVGVARAGQSYDVLASDSTTRSGTNDTYVLHVNQTRKDVSAYESAAADVRLRPMVESTIRESANSRDTDLYRIELSEGDFFRVSSDSRNIREIEIYRRDSHGNKQVVASNTSDLELGVRVSEADEYFVKIKGKRTNIFDFASEYKVTMQRIAESEHAATAFELNQSVNNSQAGPTAWLDGNTLHIVGPTGYGFEIDGQDWQVSHEKYGKEDSVVYSTDSGVALETFFGDLDLPDGVGIEITTTGDRFLNEYGTVVDFDITLGGLGLGELASFGGGLFEQFDVPVGLESDLISTPGFEFGIALGEQLDIGAPLSANVPYLYAGLTAGAEVEHNGVEVEAYPSKEGGAIAIDPMDAVFGTYDEYGVGASIRGRIPFEAAQEPENWRGGDIFGNLWGTGWIEPVKGVELSGEMVLDLDANDDGSMLGHLDVNDIQSVLQGGPATDEALQDIEDLFHIDSVDEILGDIEIGLNGGVSVGASAAGIDLWLPMASGTAILSGEQEGIYFRGASENPFEDTPILEQFSNSSDITVDGHVELDGSFSFDVRGEFNVGPMDSVETEFSISNHGIYASATVSVMGMTAELSGQIHSGGFHFVAMAELDLGPLSGFGLFQMGYEDGNVFLTAFVHASMSMKVAGLGATFGFIGNIEFEAGSDGLEFNADVDAYGTAHLLFTNLTISVGLGFGTDGVEFRLLGQTIGIDF